MEYIPKPTAEQVIDSVAIMLEAMCELRGIDFENLDKAMIDKILCSAYK